MAVYPLASSSSKRPPSLKHALAHAIHIPPLSGLALTLVLILAEEVHLALADGDDHKVFNSALRAKVSELLVENNLIMGKRGTKVDSSSHKVSLRKVRSVKDTITSGQTNRQLTSKPVNLINGLLLDDKQACLSLVGNANDPDSNLAINLQVCDGSERQKWNFDSNSTNGPIQSYFNNDLCLGGNFGQSLMPLQCDGAPNQQWSQDGSGIIDVHGMFLSVENGCEGIVVDDSGILDLQDDLSYVEWTQLGSDLNGEGVGDLFGKRVSISADGSTVAVGAIENDGNGSAAGQVRVFKLNVTTSNWAQLGKDFDGDSDNGMLGFGVSLSDDGSILAIGAPKANGGGINGAGQVKVHRYNSTSEEWEQMGQNMNGEDLHDWFGRRVSLSSDGYTVAVGAHYNDDNGNNAGHVRVFQYDEPAQEWKKLGSDIQGENAEDEAGVGMSLSSDGHTVAVGSSLHGEIGNKTGHVQVFGFDGTEWRQIGYDIEGANRGDRFGFSVSLSSDGSVVAIGNSKSDKNGIESGHAQIFKYVEVDNAWKQLGGDIVGESEGDKSGRVSISATGKIVAIGSFSHDGDAGTNSGHTRIYEYNNVTDAWNQLGDDIEGEKEGDKSGFAVSLSADGHTVVIGATENDDNGDNSGHVRIFNINPNPCTDHQKWNITSTSTSQSASPGLNVTISRTGDVSVAEGPTSTQKTIILNYTTSTNGGKTVTNATIFEKDCKTPANETLPLSSSMEGDDVLKVEIDFNPSLVENNPNVWEARLNGADVETGGDFRFCVRVDMFLVGSEYGLNFHETNLTGSVDKTVGAGFTLVVNVTRDDAKEETVNDVNFDASVVGSKCDVSTFTSNNDPVSQGSVLGLCVRSNTTGIKVVGWDSLKISRPLFDFEAIKDGVAIPVLVAEACDDGKCTSQVQLVSGFFDSDGKLSVDGKVILAVNDTRRHLVADMNDVTDISDEAFGRILTDQGPTGGFKLDIDVVSSVSASTTLYPGSFYPFVVAFMALKFLIR